MSSLTPTTTLTPTGSISRLMDELYTLELTVNPNELTVYRWRPRNAPPEMDAGGVIYNWLRSDSFAVTDVAHWKDTVEITARVGIRHSDESDETARIERYFDQFRDVIDGALWANQPLNGAARRAQRTGARFVEDSFSGVNVLAVEFTLEFEMPRTIPARG